MAQAVAAIDSGNFQQEVLEAPLPVLVDFYTTWCGPCKMLAPMLEELAEQFAGQLKVVKIDAQANQPLAVQFQIEFVPTLLFFRAGQLVQRGGFLARPQLEALIQRVLSAA